MCIRDRSKPDAFLFFAVVIYAIFGIWLPKYSEAISESHCGIRPSDWSATNQLIPFDATADCTMLSYLRGNFSIYFESPLIDNNKHVEFTVSQPNLLIILVVFLCMCMFTFTFMLSCVCTARYRRYLWLLSLIHI